MTVICSWCKEEGRPAFVGEKAPLGDARETHGICGVHLQQLGVDPDALGSCSGDSAMPRHEAVLIGRLPSAAITYCD